MQESTESGSWGGVGMTAAQRLLMGLRLLMAMTMTRCCKAAALEWLGRNVAGMR